MHAHRSCGRNEIRLQNSAPRLLKTGLLQRRDAFGSLASIELPDVFEVAARLTGVGAHGEEKERRHPGTPVTCVTFNACSVFSGDEETCEARVFAAWHRGESGEAATRH